MVGKEEGGSVRENGGSEEVNKGKGGKSRKQKEGGKERMYVLEENFFFMKQIH